jgi:hypothetical protein
MTSIERGAGLAQELCHDPADAGADGTCPGPDRRFAVETRVQRAWHERCLSEEMLACSDIRCPPRVLPTGSR